MSKSSAPPITPAVVKKDFVLAKCRYFVDVHIWHLPESIDPARWLSNFDSSEMDYAVHLLNSFLYFSDRLTNQMFEEAFHGLSNFVRQLGDSFLSIQADWRDFIKSVIITPVTGEIPSVTDSGLFFARKARQRLGLDESQILNQKDTLSLLLRRGPRPVVFVDDFVGSGNQFIDTWERRVELADGTVLSFENYSSNVRGSQFFYCPVLCTQDGYDRLRSECPKVTVSPAHVLSSKHSALSTDSYIWPDHLKAGAVKFLESASERAGIPDNGGLEEDWRGFNKLGLTLAFEHSVPDATMPIFYWERNDWKPLIRRT
jgi:hypothetical protein